MLFGEELIKDGYIDESHLARALEYQKQNKCMLGQALIDLGILEEKQIVDFYGKKHFGTSGNKLVRDNIITSKQLADALDYQRVNGGRLGDILTNLGYADINTIKNFYSDYNSSSGKSMKIGEIFLAQGLITNKQLAEAISFQEKSGGQLGEILVYLKYIKEDTLYRVLATQMNVGRTGSTINLFDSKRLPYEIAFKYKTVIINTDKNIHTLAVMKILDDNALTEIKIYLNKSLEQVLVSARELESYWQKIYFNEDVEESVYKLFNDQPGNSAFITISKWQKIVGSIVIIVLFFCVFVDYSQTMIFVNIILQIIYALFTMLKMYILWRGVRNRDHLKYTEEQIDNIDERNLPVYTILVPVYKEAAIIKYMVERLDSINYPKYKLDIRILLEEDDYETITALKKLHLPNYYTLLIIPDTQPKTKPKACNYGLINARGKYVVIYDAEDIPDRDQLKKVYLAFKELPEDYVCIQAKLNYFNSKQNLLTRWFTQEYSSWFNILLLGIMTMDVPIPLGGTSNHFKYNFLRDIGAWDPFNVTEDADLGVRLYKKNYHTAVLDSYTLEEANSNVGNWIRQRSRWIKGYMQTWLVHMRNPISLYRELGMRGFIGYQSMILGTPLLPLLNPFLWLTFVIWIILNPPVIEHAFPNALYYIAFVQLFVGNLVFIYSNILGVYMIARDDEIKGIIYIPYSVIYAGLLLPIYWIFMSIAAYKALFQLFYKPFYWEKTNHGLTDQTNIQPINIKRE